MTQTSTHVAAAAALPLLLLLAGAGCASGAPLESEGDGGLGSRDARAAVDPPDDPLTPVVDAADSDAGPRVEPRDSGPTPERPRAPVDRSSPLATNLDFPYDWSDAVPFVDAFRTSRAWTSSAGLGQPDDERPIDVDEHGWVRSLADGQIVRTGMLWETPEARTGRYTVLYDGQGELDTFGSATITERAPGRLGVDVIPDPGGGFGLAILSTDPADPVRDIRVLPPGGACDEDRARFCDASSAGCECLSFVDHHEELPFHPDFLSTLGPYSAIRFMNWQMINDNTDVSWADRPRVEDARWSVHGVPAEVLIDLSNQLGMDPWVHVPHGADDGYARELGRLIAERLDPALVVRIELSNEIWNNIFAAWEYAASHGEALGLDQPEGDRGLAQLRWQAHRSVEIFAAFDEGFGDRARVIHVLATHSVNPWASEMMLEHGDTAAHVDELAVAPYFGPMIGPALRDEVMAGTVDDLLDRTEASVPEVIGHIRSQVELARGLGIAVSAYEGGQHLVGVGGMEWDDALVARLIEVNRHPRMDRIYSTYLEGWRDAGGTLFAHFINAGGWGRWGTWGALEHVRQDPATSPKQQALERFARENARWW